MTTNFGGCGASTCYVSGVAALMASRSPLMTPEEAKRLLVQTATKLAVSMPLRPDLRLVAPKPAVEAAIGLELEREREAVPVSGTNTTPDAVSAQRN